MSVTKSRRIAGWTLITLLVISIVICLALFLGGSTVDAAGNKAYNLTDLFLYWAYFLICITLVATIVFSIVGFLKGFKHNPRKAWVGLGALIALILILVITYAVGSANIESIGGKVNEDFEKYTTAGWLKTTDMVIFTSYVLLLLNIVAIVWGAFSKIGSNKKSK